MKINTFFLLGFLGCGLTAHVSKGMQPQGIKTRFYSQETVRYIKQNGEYSTKGAYFNIHSWDCSDTPRKFLGATWFKSSMRYTETDTFEEGKMKTIAEMRALDLTICKKTWALLAGAGIWGILWYKNPETFSPVNLASKIWNEKSS